MVTPKRKPRKIPRPKEVRARTGKTSLMEQVEVVDLSMSGKIVYYAAANWRRIDRPLSEQVREMDTIKFLDRYPHVRN